MRVPLSWLRSLTPVPAVVSDRPTVFELALELDALGLVVEGIDWVGEGLEDVVLAQVLEIAPIEGADRIRRVVLDRGDGETAEVVCGAWNFEVGDVVPLAPVGSVLPGDFKIGRRKMKGVVSNGMICSARELSLGDDHEGIMVLARPERLSTTDGPAPLGPPPGVELGRPIGDFLGIGPDAVLDIAVEANRPDCLCMLGIARDVAARYELPLWAPEPVVVEATPAAAELASVEVAEPLLCRRLAGRVMSGLSIVPSPPLVQRRLALAGMRPIDCLVDASNYVMLELGQPTHPYDLDALGGQGLRVRAAHPGETIVTLDGTTRILGGRSARPYDPATGLDCVICNANDLPVGIGGVMGGRSSEITNATTSVLLEAADFVPAAIGRTSHHLGLRTEASVRFERGIDPEGIERAADRVCELVVDAARFAGVTPPTIARGILDDRPVKTGPTRLRVRPSRVNRLLGTSLGAPQMIGLLEPIGYRMIEEDEPGSNAGAGSTEPGEDEALVVEVPSFRPDVGREVDVIEEVARMYGYRKITPTARRSPHVGRLDPVQLLRRRLRRVLCGLGAHEAWTASIVDPADQRRAGWPNDLVRLANPMVAEESALRAGLLAGLLGALRYNTAHRRPWIRLFEVGEVFAASRGEVDSAGDGTATALLPDEREQVAVLLALEDDDAAAAMNTWRLIADALGIVRVNLRQDLPDGTGVEAGDATTEPPVDSPGPVGLHRTRSGHLVVGDIADSPDGLLIDGERDTRVEVALDGEGLLSSDSAGVPPLLSGTVVGVVGEVDPDVIAAFELPARRVGWLELNLEALAGAPRRPRLAAPVSRYPSSDVDLAFVVDESVPAWRVEATLRMAAGELCEFVELFDVYRGAGVEEKKRSLAYRLRLSAVDHTLTEPELAELRGRCIDAVEAALPAVLRN